MIYTKTFSPPPVCRQEILRYAGCPTADPKTEALLDACLQEAGDVLTYRVCWTEAPSLPPSRDLEAFLKGSEKVILFAATLGVGLDRLMAKYGALSPAKALMLQAIGAERIESLCDAFSAHIAEGFGLFPGRRFSPGYGDVPLETQREIFALLEPMRHIGLSLTDHLLMSPTKSVTAWLSLDKKPQNGNKCSLCPKADCEFRSAL